jgi:molybdenum cofactor cytidylyltransferase
VIDATIGAVVLAAGRGTRFGGDKVVAPWRGTAVVRHVVDRLACAGLSPIVVVAAPGADEVRRVLEGTEAQVVENARRDDGLSASLRCGVESLDANIDAFVVALGDQPEIAPAVVAHMVEIWRNSNAAAVVPAYRDGRGNPVLFDDTMRRHLTRLTGDAGARGLLEQMGERVVAVPVDADAPRDVDTRDDLRALGD